MNKNIEEMDHHEIEELAKQEKLPSDKLIEMLKQLRKKGGGILGCILFVRINQDLSLNEAKEFVINSEAWLDKKEEFIQHQHDMFMEFIEHSQGKIDNIKTTFTEDETHIEVEMKEKEGDS